MGDRINNMGKMMKNPKQRNMYMMVVGAAVITLVAGFYISTKSSTGPQANTGAVVAATPKIDSIPGASTNPQYNNSIQEANDRDVKKALEDGKTFLPTLTSDSQITDVSPLDALDREKQKQEEELLKKQKEEEELNRLALEKQREDEERARKLAQLPQPQVLPTTVIHEQSSGNSASIKKGKYGPDDALLIATLQGNWTSKESSSEFDFAGETNQTANQAAATATNTNATTQTTTEAEAPYAKAGTIYNAVLETGINSDEPSPVLAKIVAGPLKGTRLIGSLNTVGKKVIVQFSTASIPGLDKSISISAYAIDPKSSRTALADDVDNHYFLKYGVLLASAFLSGYSDAIARQNTTTTIGPLGTTTVAQGELPTSAINKQALGNVGRAISQAVGSDVQNIKPTITVNSGGAIGILLLSDLVIK